MDIDCSQRSTVKIRNCARQLLLGLLYHLIVRNGHAHHAGTTVVSRKVAGRGGDNRSSRLGDGQQRVSLLVGWSVKSYIRAQRT